VSSLNYVDVRVAGRKVLTHYGPAAAFFSSDVDGEDLGSGMTARRSR